MNKLAQSNRLVEEYTHEKISKLDEIKKMDPLAFERFTGALFEKMGYKVSTTPESGDEGIDLRIEKDGKTGIVQCKR